MNVKFDSISVQTCLLCGEVYFSETQMELIERLSSYIVIMDGRFVDGDVLKYARKSIGLTRGSLAGKLRVPEEHTEVWESNKLSASRVIQLAILALIVCKPEDVSGLKIIE